MDRIAGTDKAGIGEMHPLARWGLPSLVFAVSVATYLPAVGFGFSNLDDPTNFISNLDYRGLSWKNFAWFFTTYHMGHYQPLNWLSFAIDYSISGVDAGRFHLTQILLHGVAAVLIYRLIVRLVGLARPSEIPWRLGTAALAGALFFSLHPQRTESVVWASARTDVLACIFCTMSILAYLRHAERRPDDPARGRWLVASFLAYLAAVLAKEMAVTLPLILVLLDIHPLKRLPLSPRQWFDRCWQPVWVEKAPYVLISILCGVNAFFAAGKSVASLEIKPLPIRLAQMSYSFAFYIWKAVLPVNLSPLYEMPGEFGLTHRWFIASALTLLGVWVVLLGLRTKAPGLIAAAAAYLILILPISGLIPRGPQLVADRYSYLACVPLVVPVAYGLVRLLEVSPRSVGVAAAAGLFLLAMMTRSQMAPWRSPVTLWQHAIALDSHNATAHALLAHAYKELDRIDDSIKEYQTALLIRPSQPQVHRDLAAFFSRRKQYPQAIEHYLADIRENPDSVDGRYYLALAYERSGDIRKADDQYREALTLNPDFVLGHVARAKLLLANGYEGDAEPHLRRVLELEPDNAAALELLAQICANTGRKVEALALYDRVIVRAEAMGQAGAAQTVREIRDRLTRATSQPTAKGSG